MTLSVKTRFEVFKRDRFTCQYCGKHPPDVLLEADHIVPRAAGGSDDIANLTTACSDCNRGKGARLLEEGTSPAVSQSAIAEMQERIEQTKAYMAAATEISSLEGDQVWSVEQAWCRAFKGTTEDLEGGRIRLHLPEGGAWPEELTIKKFLRKIGLREVLEAVDIAAERIGWPDRSAVKYFYGICYHKSKNAQAQPITEDDVRRREEDSYFEGYNDGKELGTALENKRIRDLLLNREENGFASLADVVQALWPEPD